MSEETLLPCPFCGESDLEMGSSTPDREGVPIYMICVNCGACGPWKYAPIDADKQLLAAKEWNTRVIDENPPHP